MPETLHNHYCQHEDSVKSLSSVRLAPEEEENSSLSPVNARLSALGQVASGIAHEISNPLATIKACAEGLLKRLDKQQIDAGLFKDYLKIIDEEVVRCSRITSSILFFVKDLQTKRENVDVHAVLDSLIEKLELQGRLNEITVVRNYRKDLSGIPGRECELSQVCSSITLNAVDAMGCKGTLTLETGKDGNKAFIKIGNNGPALPGSHLKKIFDPFFTTKSRTGGTGLGLYIAKNIIKDNNGTIDVVSEEGKDTTFTITLPL